MSELICNMRDISYYMNLKLASILVSVVLIAFIGGYVFVIDGPSSTPDNTNNSEPVPNISDSTELINNEDLPPSMEKTGDYSYALNKTIFINNHTSILEAQSVTTTIDTNKYNKTIQKRGDLVYIIENRSSNIIETYHNGDYSLIKSELGGSTTYDAERGEIDKSEYKFDRNLNLMLSALEINSVDLTENDNILIHMISEDEVSVLAPTFSMDEVNFAEAYITVNQDGLVKQFNTNVKGTALGSPITKSQTYSVQQVSDTTISQPNWISEAEGSNTLVKGTLDVDDNIIQISHEGLRNIDPNTKLTITENNEEYSVTIPQRVTKGDDIYLSSSSNGWNISVNNITETGTRDISSNIQIEYTLDNTNIFNLNF